MLEELVGCAFSFYEPNTDETMQKTEPVVCHKHKSKPVVKADKPPKSELVGKLAKSEATKEEVQLDCAKQADMPAPNSKTLTEHKAACATTKLKTSAMFKKTKKCQFKVK